ncbi:MAG: AI-2E family transporter [Bacteroidia bacterium]|nr:MAG: AI-2E family transporter [Bacteroidia bacterium]
MTFSMNKIIRYLLIIAGISSLIFLLWYLRSIVLYILISGLISLIGIPLTNFICKLKIRNFRIPRSFAAALTLLFFWLIIFFTISIIVPEVAKQANEISKINIYSVVENLNEPIKKIEDFAVKNNLSSEDFAVKKYLREKLAPIFNVSYVSNFFASFAGMLGDIFVAFFSISFISFFFLKDNGIFPGTIILLIPQKYIESVEHIFKSINKFLVRYFVGIIVEVSLVMFLNTIGLTIIGLRFSNALVIGMIAGIMNVIPYIGPIIGASIGLVFGVATHLNSEFYTDLLPLLGLMVLVFGTVQIIDNVVFQPLIYSSSVKAHPLEVFLVILIAANVAGIFGMILAIPTYTIIRVIAKEFFNNYKLVERLTSKL